MNDPGYERDYAADGTELVNAKRVLLHAAGPAGIDGEPPKFFFFVFERKDGRQIELLIPIEHAAALRSMLNDIAVRCLGVL